MDFSFFSELFYRLVNVGRNVIEFLGEDFFGHPLIYWLFGAGLITYLTAKIVLNFIL